MTQGQMMCRIVLPGAAHLHPARRQQFHRDARRLGAGLDAGVRAPFDVDRKIKDAVTLSMER